jgi:YfiH family protein
MTLPPVPSTFHWTDESWGAALRCIPLEPIAWHLFTTRQLPLSDAQDVDRLAGALGVARVVMGKQVHGREVLVVRDDTPPPASTPEVDAIVSNARRVGVAVRAADCVPLLMADGRTGSVAAVHAGWRGTAAGVAPAALARLRQEFGTDPADVIVAIGPSIGGCCYEVGTELVDAFAAAGHERYLIDRWFLAPPPPRGSRERPKLRLDVAGANRDQLVLAGVRAENIHSAGLCTAEHLDVLTSFRVEKDRAGRIAGAIARP